MVETADAPVLGYFWAAILGIVQGVAEFLPISSSGHLALVEHLGLGRAAPPAFDVFLHCATLLVVLAYFRRTILWYVKNDKIVLWYVVLASIPTGIIGLACKPYFEALRNSPTMICVGLLVTACALSVAEIRRGASYQLRDLGWGGAIIIGLCQSMALAPGVSRSGSTIAGAMICGVEREEAFGFSFIISIPAVGGAVLLHFLEAMRGADMGDMLVRIEVGPYLVGFALAALFGFLSLAALKRIVAGGRLVWFAAYCCLAALAGLVYFDVLV
jgi:Uncharacterized bacitracin resistance protein